MFTIVRLSLLIRKAFYKAWKMKFIPRTDSYSFTKFGVHNLSRHKVGLESVIVILTSSPNKSSSSHLALCPHLRHMKIRRRSENDRRIEGKASCCGISFQFRSEKNIPQTLEDTVEFNKFVSYTYYPSRKTERKMVHFLCVCAWYIYTP